MRVNDPVVAGLRKGECKIANGDKRNKNKAEQARDLPLTSRTARFQSKRVYFQIQERATLGQPGLNPDDWGWEFCDSGLMPIMTNIYGACP